jgi:molybdopterin molybdotransferase
MALLPVAEALARVLAEAKALPAEAAPLAKAHGRVLAQDLVALRTQPPDDVSAMDGYAVRAADVKTAPARLKLIGEVAAGRPLAGVVGSGEAARIFTGGVLPAGADTVVIQENSERDGDTVVVNASSVARRHVRARGLDFTKGDVLLPAGRRLSDRDLGLAAAMNHPVVGVHRAPRVAVLATGDELVMPGTEPGPGEIVYSNGFALAALARREGADVTDLGIVPDKLDATVAALRRARELDVDVLVTTGGASVGDYDLVQQALASEGLTLSFWKIALRPGKPMMHGRLGQLQVIGLPGNPVSSYVCAVVFLVPLIRRLSGRRDEIQPLESARLGRDLPANDERADYLRATLAHDADGNLLATALGPQDSSMMSSLAKSDALIVRNPHAPAAKAGEPCAILKLAL